MLFEQLVSNVTFGLVSKVVIVLSVGEIFYTMIYYESGKHYWCVFKNSVFISVINSFFVFILPGFIPLNVFSIFFVSMFLMVNSVLVYIINENELKNRYKQDFQSMFMLWLALLVSGIVLLILGLFICSDPIYGRLFF